MGSTNAARNAERPDYLVVGAGVIGLAVARELKLRAPASSVLVIEKEPDLARHASGRNSGVLHAGFYYTADSLKAKLTQQGNQEWKALLKERGVPVLECGKLVVAASDDDLPGLDELLRRAAVNGVPLERHGDRALWSPTTAVVDPVAACRALADGLEIRYNEPFDPTRHTAGHVINCAGLYADRVARHFGVGRDYTLLPFKGVYLKAGNPSPVRFETNIYPVPNLANPFLGTHVTLLPGGGAKLGPTAIPALWREQYGGLNGFRFSELLAIAWLQARLWLRNDFQFRRLAREEIRKYRPDYLRAVTARLVPGIDLSSFDTWSTPGIRAQLVAKKTMTLVQDFLIEGDHRSTHVLNAVSPAFTCALPFARLVVDRINSGTPT